MITNQNKKENDNLLNRHFLSNEIKKDGIEIIWLGTIANRKKMLENLLRNKEESILGSPEGHLRIQDRKSYALYYWIKEHGDTNGEFLPKKKRNIAKKLAQKDYDQKLVKVVKKELKIISKYYDYLDDYDLSSIYNNLSDKRKELVTPIMLPDEEFKAQWLLPAYAPMGFEDDAPEYYSDNGVRVRSKSEIIIANMLEKYDVPFKYEFPLDLGKWGTVRPDFTCLNTRTRKEFIWEHFGMMDNEGYANKNIQKINAYEDNGFLLGNNMIMTFETSQIPINSNNIKTIIRSFLL